MELPERLTSELLWQLVGAVENERLEFGRSMEKDVAATIAAMAMSSGGRILLGVENDRGLCGCTLDQRTFDRIKTAAADMSVDVAVRQLVVDDVPVVEILVPAVADAIVTTTSGRLLRRVGSENRPLVGGALGAFVRDRTGPVPEDLGTGLGSEAVDLAALNHALSAAGRQRVRRSGAMRALADLSVLPAGRDELTRGAVLLFGGAQAARDLGFRVQLVHRSGAYPADGVTRDRREVSGPLQEVADAALDWVAERNVAGEVVVAERRQVVHLLPVPAVREALLNALAHRDLSLTGATIDVVLWEDALQVRSPGRLAGHVTLENMRAEHFSRNPRVMRVLKLLDLVEEFGEGMDRMYGAMEGRLLPEPVIEGTEASVTVTLKSHSPLPLDDQVWLTLLAPLDLSVPERRALALARGRDAVARKDLAAVLHDGSAGAVLVGLVDKGLLVRQGERGGARYSLSNQVVALTGAGGLQERQRQRQRVEEFVRARASVTSQDVAGLLDEDVLSARALLQDLVRAGRLTRTGRTRGTRYHHTRAT